MRKIQSVLFVFTLIFLIGTVPSVLSADDVDLVTFYSVKEITQTSLTLAEINLKDGNIETSKNSLILHPNNFQIIFKN